MKRIISSILMLSMLILIPVIGFAENDDYINKLTDLEIVSGDQYGNLHLEDSITRAEMMKVVAKLSGVLEISNYNYKDRFTDVSVDDWYANYVQYAYINGYSKGTSATTFDPNSNLTRDQAIVFIMRVLGYDDVTIESAVFRGSEIGLLTGMNLETEKNILRKDVFILAANALSFEIKGENVTLYTKANEAFNYNESKKELEKNTELTGVIVLSEEDILIDFNNLNTYVKPELIKVLQGDKEINIVGYKYFGTKQIQLKLEGVSDYYDYDVSYKENSFEFSPNPVSERRLVIVPNETESINAYSVKITFSMPMDMETALKKENYSFDNDLEALGVKQFVNPEGQIIPNSFVIETSKQYDDDNRYILTVSNVKSLDGTELYSVAGTNIISFYGVSVDRVAPEISYMYSRRNNLIEIGLDDRSDLDKETILNIDNYSVVNTDRKEIYEINRIEFFNGEKATNGVIRLHVEMLEPENGHIVEISGIKDIFGNEMEEKYGFTSPEEDTFGPLILEVNAINSNLVEVKLDEEIDISRIGTISDVVFDLDIEATKIYSDPKKANYIYVETTTQPYGRYAKIYLNSLYDVFGHKTPRGYTQGGFQTAVPIGDETEISSYYVYQRDNRIYAVIGFNADVNESHAMNPFSYFEESLGYAVYVEKMGDRAYRVMLNPKQYSDEKYKLELENLKDAKGVKVTNILNDGYFYGISLD